MRTAEIKRNTAETKITLSLNLDGQGQGSIDTGVGFLDHMLTLFVHHSGMDLSVHCQGDTQVDDHHSVEDIGICLGACLSQALGEKRGIMRYGSFLLPMDEALVLCSLDLSGRSFLGMPFGFPTEKIGTFDTELVQEFFLALTRTAGMTLHFQMMAGQNSHHIAEAMFKGFARALRQAASIDPDRADLIPSSKGALA